MNSKQILNILFAGVVFLASFPAGAQLSAAAQSASAAAVPVFDVGGTLFEMSANVAGANLILNGASDSTMLSARATAVGMYLTDRRNTPEAAMALKGAKRMRLVALRDIQSKDLASVLLDRIRNNSTPEETISNMSQIGALGRIFGTRAKLLKGDVVTIDWIPQGQNTVFKINDQEIGNPIPGEGFYPLMMKVWLGPKVRETTRNNLLGIGVAK
ncbi:chalcone isomerase family protein [Uliginosibacterium aquaticum]|uniref:Chalcone isomerase family protein n=1 Tax=Uliginosibacterium aquaticum TaxID=2731212 RepID=A0ABX2IKA6_9RHOO|nr:chalcone isomerase family protein [Uliginosibacterium aquaticum]NSL54761.1 chalcone isomerase family protein [Uliginosibacterium aquaticum]